MLLDLAFYERRDRGGSDNWDTAAGVIQYPDVFPSVPIYKVRVSWARLTPAATSYGSGLHLEYGEIKYTVTLTSGHMKISVTPAGTLQASLTVVAPNKQLTLVSGIVST